MPGFARTPPRLERLPLTAARTCHAPTLGGSCLSLRNRFCCFMVYKHWRLREVELFRVTQSVGSQARITGPACGDEKPERAGLNPGDLWGEDTHRQQVGILSPPGGSSSLFRSAILLGCRVPASRGTLSRHSQTRGPDSSDLCMARRVGRSVWQGTRPAFPTIYRAETARFPRPPTRPCTLIPRSPQPHRRPSAPPQQTPLPEL